ncbi:MAG: nucleotidyltransferase family protein [Legionellaceae bacterium]|nr:nucleotidyltransferase family protein [Legionellaceae bacterium]
MHTAFILCAGRGERLRPLTDYCPKPMCMVQQKPLLQHHIERLAAHNFQHVVINHAYLGHHIRRYFGNGRAFGIDISYSPEPPGGLETAGGIVQALPLLGKDPFMVINGDIFTDYPYQPHALDAPLGGHLILIKQQYAHADFGLDPAGKICRQDAQYTFAGIAYYRPELFNTCRIGRYSLAPCLREWADIGQFSGSLYEGFWTDIGSPGLQVMPMRKVSVHIK